MDENIDRQYVVDSSYMLSFLMPDEQSQEVVDIFELYSTGKIELITTTLLSYEILNTLKSAVLRRRVSEEAAYSLLEKFTKLRIAEFAIDKTKVLEMAIKYHISGYDASFLVLADSYDALLLTHDIRLQEIATKA